MCTPTQLCCLSTGGIGAFGLLSQGAMMREVLEVEGGASAPPPPFVDHHHPLTGEGETHEIVQGEGGEQKDASMPALFTLGQQRAVLAGSDRLLPTERLLAFMDDVYVICPDRVSDVHAALQQGLWVHSRIQLDQREDTGAEPRRCASTWLASVVCSGRHIGPISHRLET